MKKVLFATGIAIVALASVASAQGYQFTSNLTVGSTGPAVVALQTWLVANGYSIPSISSGAAAKGYFGSQTQAAVKQYQASHGIPSTGFFGPLTRAALNSGATGSVSTGAMCPAGYVCTPTGGTTGGTVTGGITTPGVPGIMSVSAGPLSSTVLNVGAQMVPLQTVRVQAQYSDLDVQSITLDLGNNTGFYNKLFSTIYVTDGTNVLATQSLNSSTVVQSGTNYILGVAGFHFIVPKGTYKDLVIKGTLNSSIDSTYIGTSSHVPGYSGTAVNSVGGAGSTSGWAIGVVQNGLRAVDGAGLNLYGPASALGQNFTINQSLVDNAQANISLDPSSPLVASIPVSDTTNGQYLGLPVLVFDVNAQNDALHLRTLNVNFSVNGGGTVGAAYLYQGSTQIASASISGNAASFTNISNGTAGASIPVNTTVPFTVKVDVTGVTSNTNITASTSLTQTILSSNDSTVSISGAAQGNTQTVAAAGPLFTLVGTPTITKSNISSGNGTDTLFQYSATFNVNIQAIGTNVLIGLPASTTNAFSASFGTSTTGANLARIYQDGVATSTNSSTAIIASYSQPSNTTLTSNTFTVARNQSVTVPVTYTFTITNPGAHTYSVQLEGINWNGSNLSNFMVDQPAWRTSSI
ncbi:MAG: baaA1 [Candidatus Parcubacteria bacterium]|nr:baaA1 [Candidatus Parcubacteria bacterium]